MSRELNPSQIWSQVPVANRLIEVNTKTGFSLTAGSYSVRASSTQSVDNQLAIASLEQYGTISSVTTTRVCINSACQLVGGTSVQDGLVKALLFSATTVRLNRGSGAGSAALTVNVQELF